MKITDEYLKTVTLGFHKRLKGYTNLPRSRYYLLINKDMSESEFILYCFIWDVLADWDSRHDKYGLFEINYDLLAHHMKWSTSKLRRVMKSLIDNDWIYFVGDRDYAVRDFEIRKQITSKDFNFYNAIRVKSNNVDADSQ